MKLRNGDILICTANRFIPNIIKKVTKSKYNHTAIFMNVWGKDGVIEAQEDGINWKPFDVWEKKYEYKYLVYRKKVNSVLELEIIANKAFEKAGHVGYDFLSFVIRQPWKLLTGKWKYRGDYKEMKYMICSEFVAWVFGMAEWWKMTPDDNKKYMDKSNNYYLVKK